MRKIKVDKYEIVEDLENGVFKALRNGEEWRNLTGDKLILSLVNEIERLNEKLERKTNLLHMIEETTGQNALKANEKVGVINMYMDIAKGGGLLNMNSAYRLLTLEEINSLNNGDIVYVEERNFGWQGECKVSIKVYNNGRKITSLTPLMKITPGHGYSFWNFGYEDYDWLHIYKAIRDN